MSNHDPIFDERLMTAERLLALAGDQSLRFGPIPTILGRVSTLDCGACCRPIARLTDGAGWSYSFSARQLLQDVLRHLVMVHDVPLSGKKEE